MRRRNALALLLVGTLISGSVAMAAEAGSAGDPLIALNWLKNTFIPDTVSAAEEQIDTRMTALSDQMLSSGAAGTELRVKRGDVLRLESGSSLTGLAGSLSAAADGTIVDLTAGEEFPSTGGNIALQHHYLAAESTKAAFSVTSDTAVIRLSGPYQLNPSMETDYNALAGALKTMGLFRGSDVAYGSGYDLETAPTRIQGLIMFLRLMGEEQYALAYPGSGITFADVPDWAFPYVAYAYDKGYTKGQDVDSQWRVVFGSESILTAKDYMTFLLRALGYAEGTDFHWVSAVQDGEVLGVLTAGETALLTSERPFLRAQVAYLSYFALSAKIAGSDALLLDRLTSAYVVDPATASAVMAPLASQRL